jgi:hypothetical protein
MTGHIPIIKMKSLNCESFSLFIGSDVHAVRSECESKSEHAVNHSAAVCVPRGGVVAVDVPISCSLFFARHSHAFCHPDDCTTFFDASCRLPFDLIRSPILWNYAGKSSFSQ